MTAFARFLRDMVRHLVLGEDVNEKLRGAVLYRLEIKLMKKIVEHKTKYTFSLTEEEALALYATLQVSTLPSEPLALTLISDTLTYLDKAYKNPVI